VPDEPIPVARPTLDERSVDAARRAILSGWVTQGREVAAFEREFADSVGAPYARAVSNCTAALHLALLAVGIRPGDHVLTVSHSFVAATNAIRQCGATAVFIDIEPHGFNLDPKRLEAAVTPQTKAILCVHQIGMPCDLEAVLRFSRPRGLAVVEDAACATGSEILLDGLWQKIGKPHGDIACFSFHPRKVLTTGEGGMLTTARGDFDRQFRLWRQHGMTVSDLERHRSDGVVFESYTLPGYNYKMTDIQAAIGREQLRILPEIVQRRRYLAERYRQRLSGISWLQTPVEPEWARSNWQSYCVELGPRHEQRVVMEALLKRGIATRRGIMCTHREPAGAGAIVPAEGLPRSEQAQDHGLLLPLYAQLSERDQDRVIRALHEILG
jgi:dTDP-4-amino-4,6-dideoxygalactose transaminase